MNCVAIRSGCYAEHISGSMAAIWHCKLSVWSHSIALLDPSIAGPRTRGTRSAVAEI